MRFYRTYLSQQVADRLAVELRNGAWHNHLPGERALAAFFSVSRRTIRMALAILGRTGTIRSVAGRKVFKASLKNLPVKRGEKTAVLVTSAIAEKLRDASMLILRLAHYFALSGYTLQTEIIPVRANLRRRLEVIGKGPQASVWLLVSVAKEVQRWFERHRLPSLIIGSRHECIHLPDLDFNYRAVCRHAANTLLRLGHRRVVFLSVHSGLAGDLAGECGFNEAFSAFTSGPVMAQIVRHKGSVAQIGRLLDRLFKGTEAPTAMIVSRSHFAMTAQGHLLRMGKRIPEDVSLICRDDDPLFEFVVPSLAHYRVDLNRFARRAMQLAMGIDQGVSRPSISLRIIPQFVPGKSVAAVRVIRRGLN